MEPAGAGALMALLEERRKKLAAEGLFEDERKKDLPYLPEVIGVVTSPSGAVIRDILHRLADRFPRHVVVWPVRVQGETSGEEVARAIRGFNALEADGPVTRPDVIIVARGGGSLEDLWGFNEEAVVRAAADSDIPIISAVGHETDWTLIDQAADHRAPTPTGAAERVVPVRMELAATVDDYSARLQRGLSRTLSDRQQALRAASRGLPKLDEALSLPRQRLDAASGRLGQALRMSTQQQQSRFSATASRLTRRPLEQGLVQKTEAVAALFERSRRAFARTTEIRRQSLDTQAKLLASLGYQSVLERGFALVRNADGKPIRNVTAAKPEQRAEIQFQDGRLAATLHGQLSGPAPSPQKPKKKPKPAEGQGTLF
ncbi:MAG: exodeoxyribonuclease VII large subunit, partial [Rhizobiales bacterium]|nr:exodeoxyribonuclease VII large subunit [Hyphomicrobiales bacterium]